MKLKPIIAFQFTLCGKPWKYKDNCSSTLEYLDSNHHCLYIGGFAPRPLWKTPVSQTPYAWLLNPQLKIQSAALIVTPCNSCKPVYLTAELNVCALNILSPLHQTQTFTNRILIREQLVTEKLLCPIRKYTMETTLGTKACPYLFLH